MVITLDKNELIVAMFVGSRRNGEARFNNRKPRFPEKVPGELWGFHIESACAELAVCKYLGIYWGFGVNTFHVSDIVNTNLEIRWSMRQNVKVRPDDSGIVISVTGQSPSFKIAGWINAEEAKIPQYLWKQEPICYFVPHENLNPIEQLTLKPYKQ